MKHENSRKQVDLLWITIGLLLIAAALFLVAYNLWDNLRAAKTAEESLRQLEKAMPSETSTEYKADRTPLLHDKQTVIPDFALFPDMEMPVETICGTGIPVSEHRRKKVNLYCPLFCIVSLLPIFSLFFRSEY